MRVTMAGGGGWVVVSEPAWKGWRAYIDGRRVQMQTANLAFLAIFVPDGVHNVRVVYLPQSFVIGRAISAVTLLALIAFGGFVFTTKRTEGTKTPSSSSPLW